MKTVIIITVLVVAMIMVSDAGKKKTGGRYKKCQKQLKTLKNEKKDLQSQIASQAQEIKELQDKNKLDDIVYSIVGCYKDTADRAIPTLEGSDAVLDGAYKSRASAIKDCAKAAKTAGYSMFAVQDGGWCASSDDAPHTFNKYGTSNACKDDGKGGPWANQVYILKDYDEVGCYKDTAVRAIPKLEGSDNVLDGWFFNTYGSRANPIQKCAVAAMRAGYSMFAVQDGGWCASSADAPQTYNKYGTSDDCKNDGEGGPWANQVYSFKSE